MEQQDLRVRRDQQERPVQQVQPELGAMPFCLVQEIHWQLMAF
jgi:hypothetical protein